jgi:hypothetical protein
MSFHTQTMLTRWAVMAQGDDLKALETLKMVDYHNRDKNPALISIVKSLKDKWSYGKKIERLATLGWIESDVCKMLNDLIECLESIREEYSKMVAEHGTPPDLDDKDLRAYEEYSNRIRKSFE